MSRFKNHMRITKESSLKKGTRPKRKKKNGKRNTTNITSVRWKSNIRK